MTEHLTPSTQNNRQPGSAVRIKQMFAKLASREPGTGTQPEVATFKGDVLSSPDMDPDLVNGYFRKELDFLIRLASSALQSEAVVTRENSRTDLMGIVTGTSLAGHNLYPTRESRELFVRPFLRKPDEGMEPYQALPYRQSLVEIYGKNPDTAITLVEKKIVGLHMSGSASLLSSLRHGLQPLNKLRKNSHDVHNGTRDVGGRIADATSFVMMDPSGIDALVQFAPQPIDVQIEASRQLITHLSANNPPEDSTNYLMLMSAKSKLSELIGTQKLLSQATESTEQTEELNRIVDNFPIVWGLSSHGVSSAGEQEHNRRQGQLELPVSDIPTEFCIHDLQPTDTPVLFVPKARIKEVEGLVSQEKSGHTVLALEDIPRLARLFDANSGQKYNS